MIATFKIFNTKTKEVKEYSKPYFGDFGEYILINANDFDTLAFNVENTALFSDDKKETIERLKTLAIAISVTYNKNKFYKNTDHELNTLHNGLFKDCVYTNGDWVGVLQKSFEYGGEVYKVGDVYNLKASFGWCDVKTAILYFGEAKFRNDSGYYNCDTVGFSFWGDHDCGCGGGDYGLNPGCGGDESSLDIKNIYVYDKNIIDEYFYKIINFLKI